MICFCLFSEKLMFGLQSSPSPLYPQPSAGPAPAAPRVLDEHELVHELAPPPPRVAPLAPPAITHTAATPMATPQGSPHEKSCPEGRGILAVEGAFSLESLEKLPGVSDWTLSAHDIDMCYSISYIHTIF